MTIVLHAFVGAVGFENRSPNRSVASASHADAGQQAEYVEQGFGAHQGADQVGQTNE